MSKSKCLGEKYLYFCRGTLFISPDFTWRKSLECFLMQYRETTMLWDLTIIKSMWSLDMQLLLKIFTMHTLLWQEYKHLNNTFIIYEKQMSSKPCCSTLQPGRKGMCFHSSHTPFLCKASFPHNETKVKSPTGLKWCRTRPLVCKVYIRERKTSTTTEKPGGIYTLLFRQQVLKD